MRILDRYVLWSFIKNYVIAFAVLVGLYIVLDMVFNFDELVDVRNTATVGGLPVGVAVLYDIVDYYFYQSFLIFTQLSGIIPVVAAAFTLLRLSRFNELTAVMAAGVPLLRIAMPVILFGAAANLILLPINEELVIPSMIPKLVRRHEDIGRSNIAGYPIPAMQDNAGRLLAAAQYQPPTRGEAAMMRYVDVITTDATDDSHTHLTADRADWDGRAQLWRLTNGVKVTGLGPGQSASEELPVDTFKSSINPDEIALYRSSDYVELLSTHRINELISTNRYGTANLLRVKHWRFTAPIMNILLLMLAIPTVLTRDPAQLKRAATMCLFLTGACMGSVFLFHQFAATPPPGAAWADAWPALMAWVPIFLWGPIAVWQLDRVKT